ALCGSAAAVAGDAATGTGADARPFSRAVVSLRISDHLDGAAGFRGIGRDAGGMAGVAGESGAGPRAGTLRAGGFDLRCGELLVDAAGPVRSVFGGGGAPPVFLHARVFSAGGAAVLLFGAGHFAAFDPRNKTNQPAVRIRPGGGGRGVR